MYGVVLSFARRSKLLKNLLRLLGRLFISKHDQLVLEWKIIDGDKTLRINYPLNSNSIRNFKNIQVQFHQSIRYSNLRMKKIQEELKKTHKLTYQYPFVWENWLIKHDD